MPQADDVIDQDRIPLGEKLNRKTHLQGMCEVSSYTVHEFLKGPASGSYRCLSNLTVFYQHVLFSAKCY